MDYEDVYKDEEFEGKFIEALAEAAAQLSKFFSIGSHRPAEFRDLTCRVTRFSFPGAVAEKDGEPHDGFIFGELEISLDETGYSLSVPEMNFQEGQEAFG